MIKPNELRIGNWINVPHGDVCIEKFVDNGVHFTDGCGGTFRSLSPIPLTPEILESCGAKDKNRDNKYAVPGSMELDMDVMKLVYDAEEKTISFEVYADCHTETIEIEVEYLHQLQNLYFALTGQELKII